MSDVIALGYLGFLAPDVGAWRTWATGLVGLQVVPPPAGAPDDQLYLRMDERGWRFAVEPAAAGGLAYTGWEVAGPGDLDRVGGRLADAQIAVKEDPALAEARQVEALLRCTDPNGFNLEFFYGAHIPQEPFVSPRGVAFVTGDLGLGHILVTVSDERAAADFYLDVLGFALSDIIRFGTNKVLFTHVNERHHSFAFVETTGAPTLGHFMVEATSLDQVGRALDLVNGGMAELTETLGKHTNDHMVSFYMRNPSGSQTEYGFGGRLIHDGWKVSTYTATAYWGHKVPGSEYSETGPVSPRANG